MGLAGAWGLSANWVEEGGGSDFSRLSGFKEASDGGREREREWKIFNSYYFRPTYSVNRRVDIFTEWPCHFCGSQPQMFTSDKKTNQQ